MQFRNSSDALTRTLALLACLWLFGGSPSVSHAAPADYIYREGTKLMLNGQQYKFAGINADTWFGCWANEVPTDAQLDQFFRELNPRSMTRVWVMPGSDLSIMDRIVAKADQYNQYLAATLVNGNADCDSIGTKTATWYSSGFRTTYHSHVRTVVTRYMGSRAIGFWELINEPDGSNPNLKTLYQETSDLIKSIDPNHLVGTGSHAAWSSNTTASYTDQHNVPNVDLISMHEYDDRTFHWSDEAQVAARALNKPFYVGEDGFCCDNSPATNTWTQNAPILKAEFDTYLFNYPECAGMMYWDFKLGYPGPGQTVNLGDGGWNVMKTYSHPYRGGTASTGSPPVAPSSLSATLTSSSQVSLSWVDNANNETGFKVERKIGTAGTYVQIGTALSNATTYQDTGLAANTTYYYRVRANNAAGDSGYSNEANVTTAISVNTSVNDNTLGTGQNQFEYVGTWQYWSGDAAKYQGDDHYTDVTNSYVYLRFTGTQVQYYGKKAPHHGKAAVSIDGGAETSVDLYASTSADQVLLYTSPVLSLATHTLKIRVIGTKNTSSTGYTISVDRVDVMQSSPPVIPAAPSVLGATSVSTSQINLNWADNANNETGFKIERKVGAGGTYGQIAVAAANTTSYQDSGLNAATAYYYRVRATNATGDSAYSNEANATTAAIVTTTLNDNTLGTGQNQFEYVGTWQYWTGDAAKDQSDDHYTTVTNAYVNFRFSGTQVKYYGKKAPHHGKAAVSIDGGAETTVDLYAGTSADQALLYTSPVLSAGSHTLKVRVTGTKNASSTGYTVSIDKTVVTQ